MSAGSLSTPALRKTALNGIHRQLGAKMVDFGGWDMPVQYSGIIDEHNVGASAVELEPVDFASKALGLRGRQGGRQLAALQVGKGVLPAVEIPRHGAQALEGHEGGRLHGDVSDV